MDFNVRLTTGIFASINEDISKLVEEDIIILAGHRKIEK